MAPPVNRSVLDEKQKANKEWEGTKKMAVSQYIGVSPKSALFPYEFLETQHKCPPSDQGSGYEIKQQGGDGGNSQQSRRVEYRQTLFGFLKRAIINSKMARNRPCWFTTNIWKETCLRWRLLRTDSFTEMLRDHWHNCKKGRKKFFFRIILSDFSYNSSHSCRRATRFRAQIWHKIANCA